MYRHFDIDDLGQPQVMRSNELEDFESFSPEWKNYQARWKELVEAGMKKKDAKQQAQQELNYKPAQNLLNKAKDLFGNNDDDPAVDAATTPDTPVTPPPATPPATAGVGSGLGGSMSIAGIDVPIVALLGVAGLGAWYFMKRR